MENKLLKDIFLLSLHVSKEKKVFTSTSTVSYALTGAVLYEMLAQHIISFQQNKIVLNSKVETIDPIFRPFYNIIKNSKNKRIKMITSKLTRQGVKLNKVLFEDLEKRRILKTTNHKFLWIFPYKSRRMLDETYREKLITDLKSLLFSGRKFDFYYASMFSLIKACQLEKKLTKDKQQQKEIKRLIQTKVKDSEIGKDIKLAFDEMQNAMTVMLITSSVVVTSAR